MSNSRNLTGELVTRENHYTFFKFIGMLPNPDKILSRTGKTIDVYRDLKNDPHVWSCIQSRKSGLLSLEYLIFPNGASPAIVNDITKIFSDMDIQQIERDMLEALLFGFQPLEIIWKMLEGNNNYIIPGNVVAKPQEWFFFDTKGDLKFRSMSNLQGEILPPMKIINVQYEASYMNPYGQALLSKCYWPVTFKNGGLRFWVNFMEKYGMPFLMGQYRRGATMEESRTLAETLANMTEDAVIVTPSDIDIKLHEASRTTSVSLYRELIKHCNSEISKALLSQTLTTELDSGSYAAAQTHYKIRREVILSDIKLVEKAFNTLIKHIVNLNYNSNDYPRFTLIFNDSDNMQKIDRDSKLVQSGIKFTKNYWMRSYGFKEDELELV